MPKTVFKKVELVGTSPISLSDAISTAIERASATVRNMSWFEVVDQRGRIADGKVQEFQVTLSIGFRVD